MVLKQVFEEAGSHRCAEVRICGAAPTCHERPDRLGLLPDVEPDVDDALPSLI